jgi:glutathione S-transferase
MLKLCGFSASNYYSKVKLALLEKDIPFEESLCWLGETDLDSTPLGKVPYLQMPQGSLCESAVIVEYLEDAYPSTPLLPSDPFARAKVREVNAFLELHLELEARKLYPQAFFGGQVSEGVKQKVAEQLKKNVAAFSRLARFSPFVAGDEFTLADCTAITHLPLVSSATKLVLGRDFLADLPVRDYLKRMAERPHVQTVNADRKANTELLMQRYKR